MGFDDDPSLALKLAWYAQRRPVYTGGNQVELLKGGQALFPAMTRAIAAAQQEVWLAFYMVCADGEPAKVMRALRDAARRGVKVHMVVDGVGSKDTSDELWRDLMDAGVQLVHYRPVHGTWSLVTEPRNWRRMHLKLCTIDDHTAFVGGINLIDDCHDLVHGWCQSSRLDYALQAQGAVVHPVQHTIRAFWLRAQFGKDWRDDLLGWMAQPGRIRTLRQAWAKSRLKLPAEGQKLLAHHAQSQAPVRVAFVLRDNLRQRRTIEHAVIQAIDQSRSTVDLLCPYFFPGRKMRKALQRAAQRGVKVRLLLQGKADYVMAALAARVLYQELQEKGVKVYEYREAWLHAKVVCIDDEWCSVGSSNYDPLSLQMNLEANLLVKDRPMAQTLSRSLQQDFDKSVEIAWSDRVGAPWWSRPLRWCLSHLARTYLRIGGVQLKGRRARDAQA